MPRVVVLFALFSLAVAIVPRLEAVPPRSSSDDKGPYLGVLFGRE